MQLRIAPTFMAVATILSTLGAAAPVSSDVDVSVFVENSTVNLDAGVFKKRKTYKGTATWYKPKPEGGSEGDCGGIYIDNNSEIVALNTPQYGKMSKDSDWCGKKFKITGHVGTATATIMDACQR